MSTWLIAIMVWFLLDLLAVGWFMIRGTPVRFTFPGFILALITHVGAMIILVNAAEMVR